MNTIALQSVVKRFQYAKLLCLGDLILDTFNHGTVDRISPERPVPVFVPGNEISSGAANVARNIAALGAQCTFVGTVGKDESARVIQQLLKRIQESMHDLSVRSPNKS